jgi:amino acid transporter
MNGGMLTDIEAQDSESIKKRSSAGSSSPDYDGVRNLRNYSMGNEPHYGEDDEAPMVWHQRFIESFKQDPNRHRPTVGKDLPDSTGRLYDAHAAANNTANSPLARHLKGRHLQMIAIGGSIGKYHC